MPLTISCAFATSPESHEHARIAESLGYRRAFFYDSPPLYPDVWVQLCRAAERTERIVLGPGVLVPSNRHPMANAAAIATLVGIAGEERVVVAVGSGFTGRMAMGQRALPWRDVVSTNVRRIAYEPGRELFWAEFLGSSKVYRYEGVPEQAARVVFETAEEEGSVGVRDGAARW